MKFKFDFKIFVHQLPTARAELTSGIPAQLTELLDLGRVSQNLTFFRKFVAKSDWTLLSLAMQPLPFNYVLDFGSNMRTGLRNQRKTMKFMNIKIKACCLQWAYTPPGPKL